MSKKKKRKINLVLVIILGILLVTAIVLGVLAYKKSKSIVVVLKDNLTLEINDEVKISSLVEEVKNASVTNGGDLVDTSTLGEKEVVLNLQQKKKSEEYRFKINVVDTTPPEIKFNEVVYSFVKKSVDLKSNVSVTDNSKEKIEVEVSGKYNVNKKGTYNLVYTATDSSNNKTEQNFKLIVQDDPNNMSFITTNGFVATIKDGVTTIDGIVIANKSYSVPSTYGDGLTSDTNKAFKTLVSAASKDDINIYLTSGFRSYQLQTTIYNNYIKADGQEETDRSSARPGHSEHQTGLAIDVNKITEAFGKSKEGKWLSSNCYKYGFILRYPKGKESITGYIYEPWHIRYVGVELATKLYNDGNWITLEEYFGIDSKYKK